MKEIICQVPNYVTALVTSENGEPITSSLIVADVFRKQHKHILERIKRLLTDIETSVENSTDPLTWFKKSEYVHEQNGETYPVYYMNRDGFTLLAMSFTGSKALEWKLRYIQAFNEMEKQLRTPAAVPLEADNRFALAKLISQTPAYNLPAICELYPEYFSAPVGSLEYRADINSSYVKWLEENHITREWIESFPTTDIYTHYLAYCGDNHLRNMGKKTFFKTLESDFDFKRKQSYDGFRYFVTA